VSKQQVWGPAERAKARAMHATACEIEAQRRAINLEESSAIMFDRAHQEPMGRVLGPATTNSNDYLGTVAADDAEAVMYEPSLYELGDLDRDRYTVLAVDLKVEGRTTATVDAIDRVEHSDALASEIAERGQGQGDVPDVAFDLPEASAEEFIRRAFSRISVRLVIQPLRDHALVVTGPSSTEDIEA
jgi:hypothetical protein